MNNFRADQNSNEKLARAIAGPDKEADFFLADNQRADGLLQEEKVAKFNQSVGDLQNRFKEHIDAIQEAGQKIAADLQHIEIMPLSSYVLVSPFKANPFQKIASSNGIITDLGGIAPQYKSEEDGETKEETPFVKVGMVVETGTDCKFIQPGDIVIYNISSEIAVPFFKFGFVAVNEQRVIAVVNEQLTQRKNEIINNRK